MPQQKPFYRRVWFWLIVTPVTLVAVLFALATPIATYAVRRGLDQLEEHEGAFARVRFNPLTLTLTIYKLKLTEKPVVDQKEALFFAETVQARLLVTQLVQFNLVGVAHIGQPKIIWVMTPHAIKEVEAVAREVKERMPFLENIDDELRKIIPFKIGRVEVQGGELLFIDGMVKERPEIWLHDLEVSIENFANRRRLDQASPAIVAASATGMPDQLTLRRLNLDPTEIYGDQAVLERDELETEKQ